MPLWAIPILFVGAFLLVMGVSIGVTLLRARLTKRKEHGNDHD